jgi:hypothetical protein
MIWFEVFSMLAIASNQLSLNQLTSKFDAGTEASSWDDY